MKKFFSKIKNWWSKHKPSKRRLIQLYAFLLYNANIKGIIRGEIYTGDTKYMCIPGLNCYSCPGAVGACPLGALQNALTSSGTRAPYYVIGILVLFGLLFARTICGFLCPVGMGQELLYKIRTPKLKKSRFTRILSYLKYVILLVFVGAIPLMYMQQSLPVPGFCKFICPAGTLGGAIGLLINPTNRDMFAMLGPLFTWKFCVLVAICVASVFIFRFFCRFICPLGAIYGFFNKFALIGVKLDKNKCTDCGLCIAHCKMDIRHVGDHECINCGECIDVCPAHAISWKGSKLFLHKNAVEAVDTPLPETKPLNALLNGSATGAVEITQAVERVEATEQTAQQTVIAAALKEESTAIIPETTEQEAGETQQPPTAATVAVKKKRGRGFWLQLAAWCLALGVLIGALVYYNFIYGEEEAPPAPPAPPSPTLNYGNQVGNLCLEFSVPYIGREGSFSTAEAPGKITVINYWGTWCTPCVNEMPYFQHVCETYGDSVQVIAIHSRDITEDVPAFINTKGWNEYSVLFAQDGDTATTYSYSLMGGKSGLYPLTVVLNSDGVIVYNQIASITYEKLVEIIEPLL